MKWIRAVRNRTRNALDRLYFELGQTTAEYALVLLAAAAVAVILIKWASENDNLTQFFDTVVTQLQDIATGEGGGSSGGG